MTSSAVLRWNLNARPTIRRAGRFPMKPEYGQRYFSHPTIALHLHEYDCRLFLGDRVLSIKTGDLTLSLPQVTSRYEISKEGSHLCIHFMPLRISKDFIKIGEHLSGVLANYARERMRYIIRNHHLSENNSQDGYLHQVIASTALQDLLLWMHSMQKKANGTGTHKNHEQWEKLQNYIHENFRRKIRIRELTQVMNRSQNYLARCFYRQFGMTIQHYILLRRLDLARQLLSTTRMAIKEVAVEVGIPDPQYFNKKFRRIIGVSPTAFRENRMSF